MIEKSTVVPSGGFPPPPTVKVAVMVAVDVPSAGRLVGLALRLMVAIWGPISVMRAVPVSLLVVTTVMVA